MTPEIDELLDVIEELLQWLRVATFDEEPGEREVQDRARAVVERYRPRPVWVGEDPEPQERP